MDKRPPPVYDMVLTRFDARHFRQREIFWITYTSTICLATNPSDIAEEPTLDRIYRDLDLEFQAADK